MVEKTVKAERVTTEKTNEFIKKPSKESSISKLLRQLGCTSHCNASSIAGSVMWIASIIISYLFIHISCQSGQAIGYINGLCQNGFGIMEYIGLLCCAPIYLIVIVVLSVGFRG
jgi:hypothetical protein